MPEQTQARRDRRFSSTLTDEQIVRIAKAGNLPNECLPALRRHLEALIAVESVPIDAGARELRKVRRLAHGALNLEQTADLANLGEALADLTPLARVALARHAGVRAPELPTPGELTAGVVGPDVFGKVALLFGVLSRLDLRPDRGPGKPTDHFSDMIHSLLAYIYQDVTGKAPSQGRGGRFSPFEEFVVAVLQVIGWRAADAVGAPRQARKAVEAVRDAQARRLARERARSGDLTEENNE